ncbi:hypothetical protein ppKF707_5065 [Metapseudomonas furukawaii]|uniref:Uncharacterized protein n=1 Tax=Metapseudomonas furukawaii TaxID=1149133 RepID=A0AAD1FHT8_METFU|nr:hypothetical protein ppKF707_5065 [Pseudomonas furukawaii]BAU76694.1 hypothetical protein KF707C_50060 [Pseudomonas furukawaii]
MFLFQRHAHRGQAQRWGAPWRTEFLLLTRRGPSPCEAGRYHGGQSAKHVKYVKRLRHE